MITGVVIAALMLAAAILVGLYQVALAYDPASRSVVGDLVYFSALGLLLLIGIVVESSAVLLAAFLGSIVGLLATIALARILTRGER